jgi:hypothetical protein
MSQGRIGLTWHFGGYLGEEASTNPRDSP